MTQVDILTQNGVYKITNTINGKIYIGSAAGSGGFQRRWKKGYNKHLTNAFLKYGTANFKFEILQICQPQFCLAYEQAYLDYYKPWNESDSGYNICKITNLYQGTRLGTSHSDETKSKMSQKRIGIKFSPTTLAKMAVAKTGRNLSQNHKDKISASNMGKKLSKDVRAKISNSHIKTPIERIDINTGEVKEYSSQASIVSDGFNQGNVFLCLVGKQKTSEGYFWKYMENGI
jgi:group I intron endonuclease